MKNDTENEFQEWLSQVDALPSIHKTYRRSVAPDAEWRRLFATGVTPDAAMQSAIYASKHGNK